MTRTERRRFIRSMQLGLVLTLLVILADQFGGLIPLERYLYDKRIKYCQLFVPAPTDKLVHLDIDDPSLMEAGRWPWTRTIMGSLIDEIKLAGAKVIALDMLLDLPQKSEVVMSAATSQPTIIDHDQAFIDALRRADNVLLPINLGEFEEPAGKPPLRAAISNLLLRDAEQDLPGMMDALRLTRFNNPNLRAEVEAEFIDASNDAMRLRLSAEMSAGVSDLPSLIAKICPRAAKDSLRTNAVVLLERWYQQSLSSQVVRSKLAEPGPSTPPLLKGNGDILMYSRFADATKFSAYVDFLNEGDGIVRYAPIVGMYHGKLIPHISLASVCALLGIDTTKISVTADAIILPREDGSQLRIPCLVRNTQKGLAGGFFEIPYFGTIDYKTMYDYPNHREPSQHVPLMNVYRIIQVEEQKQSNFREADAAILSLYASVENKSDLEKFEKAQKALTDASRTAWIQRVLDDEVLKFTYDGFVAMKPEELAQLVGPDLQIYKGYRALLSVKEKSSLFDKRILEFRAKLRTQLAGRIAILGWTATGNTDSWPTSLHASCPGVAIIGTIINGILTGHMWHRWPWWSGAIATFIVGIATTTLVARFSALVAAFGTAINIALYAAFNGFVVFDWGDRILGAAGPITAAVVVWAGVTFIRFVVETNERRRIVKRFSSYVDPELVNYVVDNPEQARLDGQVKEMSVVFTDLAGFTTISEKLQERTVPLLNDYMGLMVPIIRENRGYWNKFLGDGIMFFFNAPRDNPSHAGDAIRTTLQMQKAVEQFNLKLFTQGLPKVAMRAGITSGKMVVGDAGSTDSVHNASDYTVLGDEVNLSARLESANKAFGSRILVNARTQELGREEFLFRPIANLRVMGKTEGVMCYEALATHADATDEHKQLVHWSAEVVKRFRDMSFDACMEAARTLEGLFGTTKFTRLYIDQCMEYQFSPPGQDFNGIIILDAK